VPLKESVTDLSLLKQRPIVNLLYTPRLALTKRSLGKGHSNPPDRLVDNACAMPDRRKAYDLSKTLEIVSAFDPLCAVDTPDRTILSHHVKLVRRRNTSAWCSFFATPAAIGFQMC
jgi:hypothetical protein